MRRVLAIAAVLCAAIAIAVLGTGAGGGNDGAYKVRAIFRNAFSLVPGEDVKIAGVRVGSIDSLDVTADQQAAVDFTISRKGFGDLRSDAECTIRPQSLIGEKFVECTPTQPHAPDEAKAPPLKVIPDGQPGAGRHLLPVTNTSRPVDIDLINNIMRLPYRQRLGIIVNEFGTALAGRGENLRGVIRNADPALKATDKVLNLLASQDRVLADLAKQSDVALAPLARDHRYVTRWVQHTADLATATAERQSQFKAQFEKLPRFLGELRPTMARLSDFADQATPVFSALRPVAPSVSRLIKAMGPFSESARPALKTLGEASVPGRKALVAARPIITDLRSLATTLRPLASNLAALTTSLHDTGGIERAMDYVFYQVSAINGFDSFGHYLRASLILNLCSQYATTSDPACSAKFHAGANARAASSSSMSAMEALHAPGKDLAWRRTAAILRGMSAERAIALTRGESGAGGSAAKAADGSATRATSAPAAGGGGSSSASATPSAGSAAGSGGSGAAPAGAADKQPAAELLDYLLGGGS